MRKIMNKLFLSCLIATELIEKNQYFKLSLREKLRLKLHMMMCDACTKYAKQSNLIEKGINNLQKKEPIPVDLEKLKERISLSLGKFNKL